MDIGLGGLVGNDSSDAGENKLKNQTRKDYFPFRWLSIGKKSSSFFCLTLERQL